MNVLSRLHRITRDGKWIPEIDSLRFIAIFSVFFFHLHAELLNRSGHVVTVEPRYKWLTAILSHGDRGVPLFFVISGFILGLPFARQWLQNRQPVSVGKYFLRRLTRLEPPYVLSYVVAILLFGIYTRGAGITGQYLEHVGLGIVYLNNVVFRALNPANSVTWSLEIEIQFYILAPLFALFFRISNPALRRGIMLFIIVACGIAQIAWMQHSDLAKLSIAYYVQYFLAGLLLADLYLLRLKGRSGWWDGFAIIGWCVYFGAPEAQWMRIAFPILLLFLCAASLSGRYLRGFFANQSIAIIGGMCYSIYLLHFLLIAVFFKFTRHFIVGDYLLSFLIQVVVTGIPVLILCVFYFAIVERVFMDPDWPMKFQKRIHDWRSLWLRNVPQEP